MSDELKKKLKALLEDEENGNAKSEAEAEAPAEEEKTAEETSTEEDSEKSKVSVDAAKAADRIADRIAKIWAEQKGATSEKDAEDARKHLFQTSGGAKRDGTLDLRKMKLDDFDLKTVEEIQEKFQGQKVTIKPSRLQGGPKEMEVESAARILGFFKALLDRDIVSVKALAEGVDADGGYLVPEEFRAEVVREQFQFGVMRKIARVFPMNTDTLDIPTLAARPASYWTSENASITTSSAEFGQVTLSPNTLIARLPVSRQ